jgi:hypothetical protein
MTRTTAALAVCAGLSVGAAVSASAQEPACQPLYDAARKAQTQAGIERTAVMGDPAKPSMTMSARKTATGWFVRRDAGAWQAMPIDPEVQERDMLDKGMAFRKCAAGATENVGTEPARVWTYETAATPSTIWISIARGLPLKVQAQGVLQTSTYQATPFPTP